VTAAREVTAADGRALRRMRGQQQREAASIAGLQSAVPCTPASLRLYSML
jgi:hypothetical protein